MKFAILQGFGVIYGEPYLCMQYPVTEITKNSREYPERLRQISDSPKKLFCRGNLDLFSTECFAVVGTRMITAYGKEAVQKLVPPLARQFTIVSGLALGIDAAAHKATLDAGGKTISVLGGPVESPSPRTNYTLANEILSRGGLIISEYPVDTTIYPVNFAVRDRIISGLSRGVLIIEADEKSGSLITAQCALEQNRDVFAIPGNIFSPKSSGTNKLIQNGAKLVSSVTDIIQDYSMLDLKPVSTENPTERSILAILKTNGPQSMDAIITSTGVDAANIMTSLSMMEIKSMVRKTATGEYRII